MKFKISLLLSIIAFMSCGETPKDIKTIILTSKKQTLNFMAEILY